MERIYKFRAWDKLEKKMLYWDTWEKEELCEEPKPKEDSTRWHLEGDNFYYISPFSIVKGYGYRFNNHNSFIWLEFTGLLDKSGVEIYEGDIIEDKFNTLWKVYWEKDYARFHIVGINTKYNTIITTSSVKDLYLEFTYKGNIYENKELLNGQTNNTDVAGA